MGRVAKHSTSHAWFRKILNTKRHYYRIQTKSRTCDGFVIATSCCHSTHSYPPQLNSPNNLTTSNLLWTASWQRSIRVKSRHKLMSNYKNLENSKSSASSEQKDGNGLYEWVVYYGRISMAHGPVAVQRCIATWGKSSLLSDHITTRKRPPPKSWGQSPNAKQPSKTKRSHWLNSSPRRRQVLLLHQRSDRFISDVSCQTKQLYIWNRIFVFLLRLYLI